MWWLQAARGGRMQKAWRPSKGGARRRVASPLAPLQQMAAAGGARSDAAGVRRLQRSGPENDLPVLRLSVSRRGRKKSQSAKFVIATRKPFFTFFFRTERFLFPRNKKTVKIFRAEGFLVKVAIRVRKGKVKTSPKHSVRKKNFAKMFRTEK